MYGAWGEFNYYSKRVGSLIAKNIKSGTSIFGVTDTYEGAGYSNPYVLRDKV